MGRAKDHWIQMQQVLEDTRLAEKLGLTYDELEETDWHIETESSRDGLVYGYVVCFDGNSPQHILNKVVGLNSDNKVWLDASDIDDDENYYDYEQQYEAIIANKHYYDGFQKEILNIRRLNILELEDLELNLILKRQLYISAIGTLETFLSETFINQTDENPGYFRNFIETFPNFTKQKFQLSEIFSEYEKLKKTAQKAMLEVIYHNLDKVQNMYKATFKIDFPDIEDLSKAVVNRHDLVHRNGKTKEGEEVVVNTDLIEELLVNISTFVEDISVSLNLKG
jgi:hypothetical protein